jgi:RND family efflux transporter MFP subunit
MVSRVLLPLMLISASAAFVAWMLLNEEQSEVKIPERPVMLIDVITAKKGNVHFSVKAQGTVTPRTETTLISEVSGLITEVSSVFMVGGFFKKGDVLVRIDDRNYRADLKRAQATIASAKTLVARETGLADYAQEDWERLRRQLGSSKAATDLALRKPQLAEAMANLDFALADLDQKLGDLQRTIIRAPYDGLVREKRVDVGQFVTAGSPLAVTFAVDYAEIRLPLPDNELAYLDLPDAMSNESANYPAVKLTAEIGGEQQHWDGQIVRTEGVFDQRSRVLYVVAQVKDPYRRETGAWKTPLRIGTFVEASIAGKLARDVFVLPRGTLRSGGRIWIVDDEDSVHPRSVNIIRADEESIYINAGLDDGQLVCLTPLENPLPGARVKYEKATDDSQVGQSR